MIFQHEQENGDISCFSKTNLQSSTRSRYHITASTILKHCICYVCSFSIITMEYNPPKIIKCTIENGVFLFLSGFAIQAKMCFMVLNMW